MNLHSKQVVKKAPIASNAAVSSELAATMAFSSSSSALEEILGDRQLFETQCGISYDEALLDSDESDLEVEICEEFSDDENLLARFTLHHSGSRRFGEVEPPQTHSNLSCRPATPYITVVRGGLNQTRLETCLMV